MREPRWYLDLGISTLELQPRLNFLTKSTEKRKEERNMIEGLLVVVVASVLVTEVVDVIKPLLPDHEKASLLASVVLGILTAFTLSVDIFSLLGFTASLPYVGLIFTGLIISRGAGAVYDLLKKLTDKGE